MVFNRSDGTLLPTAGGMPPQRSHDLRRHRTVALSGIDAVIFGVTDMAEAKRFLDDWGVKQISVDADRLVYETRDGAEVIVRPIDAPDLPAPIEPGNTVREVIWGADNAPELEKTL